MSEDYNNQPESTSLESVLSSIYSKYIEERKKPNPCRENLAECLNLPEDTNFIFNFHPDAWLVRRNGQLALMRKVCVQTDDDEIIREENAQTVSFLLKLAFPTVKLPFGEKDLNELHDLINMFPSDCCLWLSASGKFGVQPVIGYSGLKDKFHTVEDETDNCKGRYFRLHCFLSRAYASLPPIDSSPFKRQ